MNLMVCIPSARGVNPATMSCIFNMRTVLEKAGHKLHLAVLYRIPLDVARDVLAAAVRYSTCEMALCLDDDVQLEPLHAPESILHVIGTVAAGRSILSLPCRLRTHATDSSWTPFNIVPDGDPVDCGPIGRVVECKWTGFGAVCIARGVFESLYERADVRKYKTEILPGKEVADLFGSIIVPSSTYRPGEEGNDKYLDDRAFCHRVREAGMKIHAALDVPTTHDGMSGCFGAELDKHAKKRVPASGLVGPDGKLVP